MAHQPTGTVTLLFTDVEGSTRLLERLGAEHYASTLALHRGVLRDVFARHDGYEVDAEGDAFFVAFARAEDAASAAAAAQAALARTAWPDEQPVRVRMGIHTGEPLVVPPRYVGLDVHRAARVMAAAHGGQVVVTAEVRSLLSGRIEVRDLGDHRLKDLSGPQRLFQLGCDEFPPLKTLYRSSLPVVSTPFFGRGTELAELAKLVGDGARIVTVTGPGGTGKTRLALQAAAELVDDFVDGVFFVPLQALTDPELVLPAIGTALDVGDDLAQRIGSRRLLVVLDNLEQVLAATPALAGLLSECPNLHVLATSRAPLRIAGEHELSLDPLELADAMTLFLETARRLGRALEPDDAVHEICLRLDSLPLAVELAAARTRMFSPSALLDRLEQRLPLLTQGHRDAPERQRGLRATIEWSYDLLEPAEARLFEQLAVFVGGGRVDAIEQVCGGDTDLADLVDGVSSLVEKSLLRRRDDPDGEPRFWMLETIREYALERLRSSPALEPARQGHARWTIDRVLAIAPRWGPYDPDRGSLVIADEANIREAIDWLRGQNRRHDLLRLVASIWPTWYHRGFFSEARVLLEEALDATAEPYWSAVAASGISACAFRSGDSRAAAHAGAEAIRLARSVDEPVLLGNALRDHANALADLGDLEGAAQELDEALAIGRASGDAAGALAARVNQGHQALMRGDWLQVIEINADARAIAEEAGIDDPYTSAIRTYNVGVAELQLGRLNRAEESFAEALAAVESSFVEGVAYPLSGFAAVAAARCDWLRTAHLLGVTDALVEAAGMVFDDMEQATRTRLRESARRALGDDAFALALEAGRAEPIERAIETALSSGTRNP